MSYTYRVTPSGDKEQLMGPEELILEEDAAKSGVEKPFITPLVVFSLVLVVIAGLTFWGGVKTKRWVDASLLLITGLFGLILLFMWFATNHQQMDWNLNVLWANPLGLFFFYFVARRKIYLARVMHGVILVFLAVCLVGWFWLPQQLNVSLIPLLIAMVIRGVDHVFPACCPLARIRKRSETFPLHP